MRAQSLRAAYSEWIDQVVADLGLTQVSISYRWRSGMRAWGMYSAYVGDKGGVDRIAISVRPDCPFVRRVLAHELRHAQQLVTGRLAYDRRGQHIWDGVPVPCDGRPEQEYPWEADAIAYHNHKAPVQEQAI